MGVPPVIILISTRNRPAMWVPFGESPLTPGEESTASASTVTGGILTGAPLLESYHAIGVSP